MSTRDLLAAVEAWCREHYPGFPFEHLTIHLHRLPVPVQLAASPMLAAQVSAPNTAAPADAAAEEERVRLDTRCLADVFEVIEEAGSKPSTPMWVLYLLHKKGKGKDYSRGQVERVLTEAKKDGTVEECERPKGFRLPQAEAPAPAGGRGGKP